MQKLLKIHSPSQMFLKFIPFCINRSLLLPEVEVKNVKLTIRKLQTTIILAQIYFLCQSRMSYPWWLKVVTQKQRLTTTTISLSSSFSFLNSHILWQIIALICCRLMWLFLQIFDKFIRIFLMSFQQQFSPPSILNSSS